MDTLAKGIGYVFVFLAFVGVPTQCDKPADDASGENP